MIPRSSSVMAATTAFYVFGMARLKVVATHDPVEAGHYVRAVLLGRPHAPRVTHGPAESRTLRTEPEAGGHLRAEPLKLDTPYRAA